MTDKEKALQGALAQIQKQFGKGSVMKMGERNVEKLEVVSTGSLFLNRALGVNGYPRRRIVEIYGPESSGKTTVALHAIAEAQKAGGTCAFIDVEHALSPEYAQKLGVNISDLIISQPDSAEEALEIAEALIRSGAIDLLVLDSIAALVPKAEVEGDMGDSHMGLQARLISQAMRKLTGAINKSNVIALFINQVREKIGIMFGNPETTPGGRAMKFYSTIRLEVRRGEQLKAGSEAIGHKAKIKVVKNKVAPPFKTAEVDIVYGKGFDRYGEIIDMGVEYGIVEKAGSWYSYNGERLAQGRENVKTKLQEDEELAKEIESKVVEALSPSEPFETEEEAEATVSNGEQQELL